MWRRRGIHRRRLIGAVGVAGGCIALAMAGPTPGTTEQEGADWWAYQPLTRPAVPRVLDSAWITNPIDAFLLTRLEVKGISPAAPAEKVALLRRAYYDLTGLPPSPQAVDAFVADDSPNGYERVLDHLLASPQYGEKWGRHWLDLVRFAETDSYERDRTKPNAWKYRDYVINAFNDDKPYDQFLLEQLAGDELDDPTLETMIATGYYRLGIWDDEPTDVLQAQYDDLDGIVSITSQVMLGTTIGCARCHDHKKDPIPQRDYYRMLAFFENIKPYKGQGGNNVTPQNFVKSVPTDLGSDEFEQVLADYVDRRAALVGRINDVRGRVDAGLSDVERGIIFAEQTDGLVAHHSFDDAVEGTEIVESVGVVIDANGRHAAAGSFDGEDDFIRIKRPVENDFTISLWFKTTAAGSGGTDYRWFVGDGLVDGEIRGIVPDYGISYHSDGRITAGTGRPETFVHSPPGYNDGAWHHAALTRDMETGRIALYLDGEQVDDATGSKESLNASEFIDIGRLQPGYNHFAGSIDDVRFYDRVLAPHEVLSLQLGSGFEEAFVARVREELGEEEFRRYRELKDDLIALKKPVRERTQILCVMERGAEPGESHIRVRGNANVLGDPVEPGFPTAIDTGEPTFTPLDAAAESSGRRRVFAEWIASRDNILTARVLANRLWQYHFGRGIVPTPNDFGQLGLPPTHPDLLDWLAVEFMDRGWSMKAMHKLIMTSTAYRMSSRGNDAALAIDPENNLYWRFDMRRLTAEEIRDSMLAVNGTLNLKAGGPGVYPEMPPEVLATSSRPGQAWGRSSPEEAARRSIYIHVKRSLLTPMLQSLDLADTDSSCPVRFVTTQPTQALTMINSKFTNDQARLFADRLRRETPDDVAAQVQQAFRLCASRSPTAIEVNQSLDLMRSLREDEGVDQTAALNHFCLVVLNLNEFIYLD